MPSKRPRPTLRMVAGVVALTGVLAASCAQGSDRDDATTSSSTTVAGSAPTTTGSAARVENFPVPRGSRPHDVAVTVEGLVWYTAQGAGKVGRLDPGTREVHEVALGAGSSPHGVIIGPDGAPWITDSGLNAILRVDPRSDEVKTFPLPAGTRNVNVHTAVFDRRGTLWFTGNAGVYGRLVPGGRVEVFDAPGGPGPYGITATPTGEIYYASLSGNHLARVDPSTAKAEVLRPPTANQGTRRVWSDSKGRVWCSQWNAGQLALYDPVSRRWEEWKLPGDRPQAYSVFVDDRDIVWLSDFGANTMVSFDPATERFTSFPLPSNPSNVRQIHGRPGEVWGAESAADKLVVIRTA